MLGEYLFSLLQPFPTVTNEDFFFLKKIKNLFEIYLSVGIVRALLPNDEDESVEEEEEML